jgi:hypothetical protein
MMDRSVSVDVVLFLRILHLDLLHLEGEGVDRLAVLMVVVWESEAHGERMNWIFELGGERNVPAIATVGVKPPIDGVKVGVRVAGKETETGETKRGKEVVLRIVVAMRREDVVEGDLTTTDASRGL